MFACVANLPSAPLIYNFAKIGLLFAIFNCWVIVEVRNVHTCPPNLLPLSKKARRSIHCPTNPDQGVDYCSPEKFYFTSPSTFNAIHVSFQLTVNSIFKKISIYPDRETKPYCLRQSRAYHM